jgi:SPP1 family predicted phage head-tail adaptor
MPGPRYPKIHDIRIFQEIDQKPDPIKQYIHKTDTTLKAYARQLTASETSSLNALQDAGYVEFVINKRKVLIDMFIEFKGRTYQISAVDPFDFISPEIKIQAYEVIAKQFVDVRWSD